MNAQQTQQTSQPLTQDALASAQVAQAAQVAAQAAQAQGYPQWQNHDNLINRTLFNSESYGGWWKGWWPTGTYAGQVRLEPGVFPKFSNPPQSNPFRPSEAYEQCGPTKPCPWDPLGNNTGSVTIVNGIPTRVGLCVRGRCQCPIGQTGVFCSGEALRNVMGDVVWSLTGPVAPSSDPYQFNQGLWNIYD